MATRRFPIEELSDAIGFRRTALPLIVLIGGILGGLGGFFMQYWMEVIDYPINVGGKPFNSWPAFIPITFECTVLVAAFSAVLGMLALNNCRSPTIRFSTRPILRWPRATVSFW
jgi:hypothetical protein